MSVYRDLYKLTLSCRHFISPRMQKHKSIKVKKSVILLRSRLRIKAELPFRPSLHINAPFCDSKHKEASYYSEEYA